MNSFLKRNIVPITGVALPVVMMILFALATWIPAQFVPPPQYGLLFAANNYAGSYIEFTITDGRLHVRCDVASPNLQYGEKPKLYRFDPATLTSTEISIPYPAPPATNPAISPPTPPQHDWQDIAIKELAHIPLINTPVSPDGYTLVAPDSYRSGFMTDIFYGSGRNRNIPAISNNSRTIRLLQPSQAAPYYSYYNATFLGWIAPEPQKAPLP